MTEEIINQTILFVVSFGANLLASVSGGGAGFVQFPLLILLGLPFATALGTHKVAVVFLGLGSLSRSHKQFNFDKTVALTMLFLGCPAVAAGSLIIVRVPSHQAEIILGVITIASGIYSFFKRGFGTQTLAVRSKMRTLMGMLGIVLVGLFSGSISSGAGFFATLVLVGIFKLDMKRAIMHTMVFVATVWNLVGAVTIGAVTSIHWQWIPVMIVATFSGSYIGTALLVKLPVKIVKFIFASVAVISGALLLVTAYS